MVLCQGRWFSGSQAQCYLPFPNEMRELPTIEAVSTSAVGNFFLNNDGGLGGAAMTSLVINERSFKGVTFTCENGASSNAQQYYLVTYSHGITTLLDKDEMIVTNWVADGNTVLEAE